jgi:hypothetical protein
MNESDKKAIDDYMTWQKRHISTGVLRAGDLGVESVVDEKTMHVGSEQIGTQHIGQIETFQIFPCNKLVVIIYCGLSSFL